ncbi:RNA polymerase sigma-70 factor, ECF subfamily [Pedobacter westerhofensis]|uniref:RNA polymerase sigma-70 factor, ECF subfamily n=1 Tax=Pedobacter westerhofensis TaxID=425512 RepID=A0A521FVM0_9SPHI|nr:RNA polymerase sigma factor [Pedobacter westerhofensis]SMO99621.1 RNA polymerase sigma-70 factor, ECF subfamily [Pedobacter westerhofensis]
MPDRIFGNSLSLYYKDLQIYARTLEPNMEEAEDLVQETLYKALRFQNQYNDSMSLRGWLFTILKNTRINAFRRKKFSSGFIISDQSLVYGQLTLSAARNDGEINCVLADIERSISVLKPDYSLPMCYFLKGYKYHEIATQLDIPIGTVKFRIHAAKEILKTQLRVYEFH